jgi:hypothetical protein
MLYRVRSETRWACRQMCLRQARTQSPLGRHGKHWLPAISFKIHERQVLLRSIPAWVLVRVLVQVLPRT